MLQVHSVDWPNASYSPRDRPLYLMRRRKHTTQLILQPPLKYLKCDEIDCMSVLPDSHGRLSDAAGDLIMGGPENRSEYACK